MSLQSGACVALWCHYSAHLFNAIVLLFHCFLQVWRRLLAVLTQAGATLLQVGSLCVVRLLAQEFVSGASAHLANVPASQSVMNSGCCWANNMF